MFDRRTPAHQRSSQLVIRCTASDRRVLKRRAASLDVGMSTWIRRVIRHHLYPPKGAAAKRPAWPVPSDATAEARALESEGVRSVFDDEILTIHRPTQIVLRCTPTERMVLHKITDALGLTISGWLREIIRDELFPPPAGRRGRH